jgi:DDE family transposase
VVEPQTAAEALAIYRAAAPPEFFQELRRASGQRAEGGVYTVELTTWMMLRQRLDPKATLSTAVEEVAEGRPQALLPTHKRVTEGTVSSNTGAYSRARRRLGQEVAAEVAERIFNYLIADVREALPGLGRQVFLLDGSSLDLPATPELRKAYPPAQNQHGEAHWPVVKLVVAHDLISGLAMPPCWGPMYGDQAVSEQALAAAGIGRLPAGAVVVADRNFGVFSTAYDADRRRYPVVVRLTDARARYLQKGRLPQQTDQRVDWKPSRWDRRHNPDLPADACVRGRVIACQVTRQGRTVQLYFFTTLELPPAQIAELYGYRWNIETDLRSLKQTVHLHSLTARSEAMVAKELVLGVAAYNLVRGTMYAAAHVAGIDPRQLSFSRVQDVVNACLPSLADAASPAAYQRVLDRMLRRAAQCKLPRRRPRPSYPRAVWPRRNSFPKRKKSP